MLVISRLKNKKNLPIVFFHPFDWTRQLWWKKGIQQNVTFPPTFDEKQLLSFMTWMGMRVWNWCPLGKMLEVIWKTAWGDTPIHFEACGLFLTGRIQIVPNTFADRDNHPQLLAGGSFTCLIVNHGSYLFRGHKVPITPFAVACANRQRIPAGCVLLASVYICISRRFLDCPVVLFRKVSWCFPAFPMPEKMSTVNIGTWIYFCVDFLQNRFELFNSGWIQK